MHIIRTIFFFMFLLNIQYDCLGQVLNVDRENGLDSLDRDYAFSWSAGFSLEKQQSNLLELSSAEELDIFLPKDYVLVLLGNTEIESSGSNTLENNGYFLCRLRDNDKRRVAPDYFAQYQWNGVLGLTNRALGGVNARFKFWENKESDFYYSTGTFYEYEKWDPQASSFTFDSTVSTVTRNLLRWNHGLKLAFKLSENIDFATSNFVQLPLNENFSNIYKPRWAMNASIFFKLNEFLNLSWEYDHNLDFYRALPIDLYYYNISVELQLNL